MVDESADRSLQSLADKLDQGTRPVHDWHPSHVASIDLRISRDGTWYYQGSPIHRVRLVKLFASVMRRDADDYYLVTPVEKLKIQVDDAPFVAVEIEREGGVNHSVCCFVPMSTMWSKQVPSTPYGS